MKRISPKIGLVSVMLLLLLLFAAPMTALADGGDENELIQVADGYQVTLVFDEPAANGENQMHIRVLDADGQPVSKALVEVAVVVAEDEHSESEDKEDQSKSNETTPEADAHGMESVGAPTVTPSSQNEMGDMEGLPETESVTTSDHDEIEMAVFDEGHEAGEYEGEINIPGVGDWNIRVHVTVDDHLIEFDFPVHVAGSQAGKNILSGFFALNAVILGVAFTLKLKSVA